MTGNPPTPSFPPREKNMDPFFVQHNSPAERFGEPMTRAEAFRFAVELSLQKLQKSGYEIGSIIYEEDEEFPNIVASYGGQKFYMYVALACAPEMQYTSAVTDFGRAVAAARQRSAHLVIVPVVLFCMDMEDSGGGPAVNGALFAVKFLRAEVA